MANSLIATNGRGVARRGAAVVELAILLPLLLMLTFGAIEYGWMFMKAHEVTNAARRAVRLAVAPDATTAQVVDSLRTAMQSAGYSPAQYTYSITPTNVQLPQPGQMVTVSLNLPYRDLSLTQMPLPPVPQSLSTSVTMAKEGPESSSSEKRS